MGPFHKVLFTRSGYGCTAGLVIDASKIDPSDMATVSRLFPWTESRYMRTYHVSPAFGSAAEAFGYVFPFTMDGSPVRPAGRRRSADRRSTCECCGVDTTRDQGRCTNGRCGSCHRQHCTPGGSTTPGHGRGTWRAQR